MDCLPEFSTGWAAISNWGAFHFVWNRTDEVGILLTSQALQPTYSALFTLYGAATAFIVEGGRYDFFA